MNPSSGLNPPMTIISRSESVRRSSRSAGSRAASFSQRVRSAGVASRSTSTPPCGAMASSRWSFVIGSPYEQVPRDANESASNAEADERPVVDRGQVEGHPCDRDEHEAGDEHVAQPEKP